MSGCRFEHVAISVSDLDRAVVWYVERFGFTEVRRAEKPEYGLKTAVIRLGEAEIEIMQPDTPLQAPAGPRGLQPLLRQGGLNHLAIAVPDVRAAYEHFRADGEAMATEMVEGRLFFVRDPFGTLIEVKQAK